MISVQAVVVPDLRVHTETSKDTHAPRTHQDQDPFAYGHLESLERDGNCAQHDKEVHRMAIHLRYLRLQGRALLR